MPKLFFLVILFALSWSCRQSISQSAMHVSIQNFAWLEGLWKNPTFGEHAYEKWWFSQDKTVLHGHGYTLRNNDTITLETIRIEQATDGWKYIVKVTRNESETVFSIRPLEEGKFEALNPEHDFPQRIYYENQGNGKLFARIEGLKDGETKGFDFNMTKVKP